MEWKVGSEEGSWKSKETRGPYGMGLWKSISRECVNFGKGIRFKVGEGRTIKFWIDVWCGERPLCEEFPALFGIAVNKRAWVADYLRCSNDSPSYEVTFVRNFHDWELEELKIFFKKSMQLRWCKGLKTELYGQEGGMVCFRLKVFLSHCSSGMVPSSLSLSFGLLRSP